MTALGLLDHESGAFTAGATSVAGTLNQDSGTMLLASLLNTGITTFRGGTATVAGLTENRGNLQVVTGGSLSSGSGLVNRGSMTLDGAYSGFLLVNDFGGSLSGRGSIATGLANNGSLSTTGLLGVSGAITNVGSITVGTAETLLPDGGLENFGVVDLLGGAISGPGVVTNRAGGVVRGGSAVSAPLTNDGGLIHANGATTLVISNLAGGNANGGELRVDDGSGLQVTGAFASSGTVALKGVDATLSGGDISHSGTLKGVGRVTNRVLNSGTIRPEAGELTLSAASNTNTASGRIQIATGSTALYTQGLAANAGAIQLTGGAFDNNGNAIANSGDITGRGTFRSGGLTNNDVVSFADGPADVFGPVTNAANLRITSSTTTFFDPVTNTVTGLIKNTAGTARFLGGLTNNGSFVSDPAINVFGDLLVGETGYLAGGEGDVFVVNGDFLSQSLMDSLWRTELARLEFSGPGAPHRFELTGEDLGATAAGYDENFAWGTLSLGAGALLDLASATDDPDSALYVNVLELAGGLSQLDSIRSDGVSIYYNPGALENAYLGRATFGLSGGGLLLPVPEPSGGLLLAGALAGLAALSRRRA